MKKFLVVVMLLTTITSSKLYACLELQTINYYMFKVLETNNNNPLFFNFWQQYVGNNLDYWTLDNFEWIDPDDLSEMFATKQSNNDIIKAAIAKNDKPMQEYLTDLITYINLNKNFYNSWDYPSEKEIAERNKKIAQLRQKAENYTGTLKERYNLMAMRCMFQQEKYADVEKFWNNIGNKTTDHDLKQAMLSLFAGALYHQKKIDSALQIFAQLGDIQSLKFCLNKKRNFKGIKEIYEKDHNNQCLPFLVQDFVNMTQETIDDNYQPFDFYKVENNEANQFANFANQIADTKATNSPCMWKTAAAMIHYLIGNYTAAQKEIEAAQNLNGTALMKDNARAIKFLVYTKNKKYTSSDASYYLNEIKWLQQREKNESHFGRALTRIMYQNIQTVNNETNNQFAYLVALAADAITPYYYGTYSGEVATYQMTAAQIENFYNYAFNNKKLDNFETYLLSIIQNSETKKLSKDYFADQIGTKYLSEHNLTKAEQWLSKVNINFVRQKSIASYMALRNYNIEPWYNQQFVSDNNLEDENITNRINENQRLKYCKDLKLTETQYANTTGERKKQIAYELATMYEQASQNGKCWYLTHDLWSYYGIEIRANEYNYEKRAEELLKEAAQSTDKELSGNALYALLWIARQSLNHWNDEKHRTNDINTAYSDIAKYIDKNGSTDYMDKCDAILDYIKKLEND